MATLVDTSGLLAFMDVRDLQHDAVRAYVTERREVLIVPVTVLPEADYMLGTRLGERAAVRMLDR